MPGSQVVGVEPANRAPAAAGVCSFGLVRGGAPPPPHHPTCSNSAIQRNRQLPPVPRGRCRRRRHTCLGSIPRSAACSTTTLRRRRRLRGSAMSFADLEAGAIRASRTRKARDPDDARGLVFQIATAVASYRRLLNSLGTPKDTPTLRDQLSLSSPSSYQLSAYYIFGLAFNWQKTSQNILQLAKDAKEKLRRATEADKSFDTSADKRVEDMKLAKDFAAAMEEFRKLQNLAIQRETAYKPVVPQSAKTNYAPDGRSADSGQMPEQRALLAESKRQEVLQLDNEIVYNETIIEEREQAIQEIQEQIGEVHEMFKDLATLTYFVPEEIDTNLDNSAAATKEAKTEVAKASKTQKSNSSLVSLLAYGNLWGSAACCDNSFGSLSIFHPKSLEATMGVQFEDCISQKTRLT
ncbi:hypothetical protein EJB05_19658, partial [Eragrostis curvula]